MATPEKNNLKIAAVDLPTMVSFKSTNLDESVCFADARSLSQEELVKFCDKLINARLPLFCKQFCYDNRYQCQCTIDKKWGVTEKDAPLCEWGNASYAWMLKELSNHKRLNRLEIFERSNLIRYLGKIINSTPFWERFKDWRFQRRIRIPEYIKAIDPGAAKIFWWLCDGDSIKNIAQRLGRGEKETEKLVSRIYKALHIRKKDHLLKFEEIISLSSLSLPDGGNDEYEIPVNDLSDEDREQRHKVSLAYDKLTWQEQYVLDAMIIDDLKAKSVLSALVNQNISIDEKVPVEKLTDQHVYYFLRKTIAKLKSLSGVAYNDN